ncbi:hypothetical protein GCM10010129_78050 [Streptomyces fumigatiscleroticus]|nr:hypothetical protein GCM10010129_78050 [Streptomyces fumigatiscleroticus]
MGSGPLTTPPMKSFAAACSSLAGLARRQARSAEVAKQPAAVAYFSPRATAYFTV